MDKGVKKVRESIMKRKKQRRINHKVRSINPLTYLPQEEEKHGYFPTFIDNVDRDPQQKDQRMMMSYVVKGILAMILFFSASFMMNTAHPFFNKSKEWTTYALTEEFPFAMMHHWYQSHFGSPLALTPQMIDQVDIVEPALPIMGSVKETFQMNGTGIMIAPDDSSHVTAWNDGLIIFAGNDRVTGKTVIIQHPDRSKSTYGYLSSVDVHIYQPVKANDKIGTFMPTEASETVFFSIEKNAQYIDPVQVIKVDDTY